MNKRIVNVVLFAALLCFPLASAAEKGEHKKADIAEQTPSVLWENPRDISSRSLFYGSGGRKDEPQGPYVFLKEDMHGSNPKFEVRDRNGITWTVKLGLEARPETAASRLLWAVGYFTNEDYFLPGIRVENMPAHLRRGREFVSPDGSIAAVRLKRHPNGDKKIREWCWRKNRFVGAREFNGLRVMMALINNWDLKQVNNYVFRDHDSNSPTGIRDIYEVSDLGSSFGTTGWARPLSKAKGNLASYRESQFIEKVTPGFVDFGFPTRPALFNAVSLPRFIHYVGMGWVGKDIPRSDAKWIGQLLAQLSASQIRDAFRAAGYPPDQVEGFTQVVLKRIAALNKL
jgi:hypothetical protein